MKLTFNEKLTGLLSIISILIAGYALHVSSQPKYIMLTVESKVTECSNTNMSCSQLFIFNNDEAPCFEFEIDYDKSLGQAYLMQGFEKSNLFNANFDSGIVSFPSMTPITILKDADKPSWLGYLGNKEIAYIKFVRTASGKIDNKLEITCAGFSKTVNVKIK